MMPKQGLIHDYDLRANESPGAKDATCMVRGASPARYQWSDYSGEGMCCRCGTPYQLQWGSDEEVAEGAYPYLNLVDEWVPIVREYNKETGRFVCLGRMLGRKPGMEIFTSWVAEHYPEMLKSVADGEASLGQEQH